MKSTCTKEFWKLFANLPTYVQTQADSAYKRFKRDPYYPSLHFKCINKQESIYSVRIGNSYRALGSKVGDTIIWYWIGSHEDYNHFISEQ
jgi:hypothetical protein